MPRAFAPLRPLVLLLLAACAPALRAPPAPFARVLTRTIAPGVTWSRFSSPAGPWNVNLVRVELARRELFFEAAHANDASRGRERTSSIARRHRSDTAQVLAAINADFFDLKTGEVENNLVIGGAIVKGVTVSSSGSDGFDNPHAQFAVNASGIPLIERFALSAWIAGAGPRIALAAVNAAPPRVPAALVLYNGWATAVWRDSSGPAPTTLRLRPMQAKADTTWLQAEPALAAAGAVPTDYLLAGYGDAARLLGAWTAQPLTLRLGFTPERGPLRTAVGGWGILVEQGQVVADSVDRREGTFPSFSVTRHPRSGIGIEQDGRTVLLVTVDGRSESSSGMSLLEFAGLLRDLGAWRAMNLDGGGSTTLIVADSLVNHPSDAAGERPVADALLLLRRRRGKP